MRWIVKAFLFLLKGSLIFGAAAAVLSAAAVLLKNRFPSRYACEQPLGEPDGPFDQI